MSHPGETAAATPAPRRRFPRAARLSGQAAFQAVFREGRRAAGERLVLWARPNGTLRSRLGLSIGRHAGGAVVRNRIKRRLREAFRLAVGRPEGWDFVVALRREPRTRAASGRKGAAAAAAAAKTKPPERLAWAEAAEELPRLMLRAAGAAGAAGAADAPRERQSE